MEERQRGWDILLVPVSAVHSGSSAKLHWSVSAASSPLSPYTAAASAPPHSLRPLPPSPPLLLSQLSAVSSARER